MAAIAPNALRPPNAPNAADDADIPLITEQYAIDLAKTLYKEDSPEYLNIVSTSVKPPDGTKSILQKRIDEFNKIINDLSIIPKNNIRILADLLHDIDQLIDKPIIGSPYNIVHFLASFSDATADQFADINSGLSALKTKGGKASDDKIFEFMDLSNAAMNTFLFTPAAAVAADADAADAADADADEQKENPIIRAFKEIMEKNLCKTIILDSQTGNPIRNNFKRKADDVEQWTFLYPTVCFTDGASKLTEKSIKSLQIEPKYNLIPFSILKFFDNRIHTFNYNPKSKLSNIEVAKLDNIAVPLLNASIKGGFSIDGICTSIGFPTPRNASDPNQILNIAATLGTPDKKAEMLLIKTITDYSQVYYAALLYKVLGIKTLFITNDRFCLRLTKMFNLPFVLYAGGKSHLEKCYIFDTSVLELKPEEKSDIIEKINLLKTNAPINYEQVAKDNLQTLKDEYKIYFQKATTIPELIAADIVRKEIEDFFKDIDYKQQLINDIDIADISDDQIKQFIILKSISNENLSNYLFNLDSKKSYCKIMYSSVQKSINDKISVTVHSVNISSLNKYINYLQDKLDKTLELSTKEDIIYFLLSMTFYKYPLFISVFIQKYFKPEINSNNEEAEGVGAAPMQVNDDSKIIIPDENIQICRLILQNMYSINIIYRFLTITLAKISSKSINNESIIPLNYFLNSQDPIYNFIDNPLGEQKTLQLQTIFDNFNSAKKTYEINRDASENNKQSLEYYFLNNTLLLSLVKNELQKIIDKKYLPVNKQINISNPLTRNRIKTELAQEKIDKIERNEIRRKSTIQQNKKIVLNEIKSKIRNKNIENAASDEQKGFITEFIDNLIQSTEEKDRSELINIILRAKINAYEIGSKSVDLISRSISDKDFSSLIVLDAYSSNLFKIPETHINYINSNTIFDFDKLISNNPSLIQTVNNKLKIIVSLYNITKDIPHRISTNFIIQVSSLPTLAQPIPPQPIPPQPIPEISRKRGIGDLSQSNNENNSDIAMSGGCNIYCRDDINKIFHHINLVDKPIVVEKIKIPTNLNIFINTLNAIESNNYKPSISSQYLDSKITQILRKDIYENIKISSNTIIYFYKDILDILSILKSDADESNEGSVFQDKLNTLILFYINYDYNCSITTKDLSTFLIYYLVEDNVIGKYFQNALNPDEQVIKLLEILNNINNSKIKQLINIRKQKLPNEISKLIKNLAIKHKLSKEQYIKIKQFSEKYHLSQNNKNIITNITEQLKDVKNNNLNTTRRVFNNAKVKKNTIKNKLRPTILQPAYKKDISDITQTDNTQLKGTPNASLIMNSNRIYTPNASQEPIAYLDSPNFNEQNNLIGPSLNRRILELKILQKFKLINKNQLKELQFLEKKLKNNTSKRAITGSNNSVAMKRIRYQPTNIARYITGGRMFKYTKNKKNKVLNYKKPYKNTQRKYA